MLVAMRFRCLDYFDGAESSIPVSSYFQSSQDIQDSESRTCYHGLFFSCLCCLKFHPLASFSLPFFLNIKKIFLMSQINILIKLYLRNKTRLSTIFFANQLKVGSLITSSQLEWLAMRLVIPSPSLSVFLILTNPVTSSVYPSWRS